LWSSGAFCLQPKKEEKNDAEMKWEQKKLNECKSVQLPPVHLSEMTEFDI